MVIERLSSSHDRENFDCGEPSLNRFLQLSARSHSRQGFGQTFVAVEAGQGIVQGYYTISNGNIEFEDLPETESSLPHYPPPVLHLGRLAVDLRVQGQRIGEELLMDALRRAVRLSDESGIYAVEVLALHETARRFYLRYDFVELADDQLHLYLPMRKIRRLFPRE